MEYKKTMRFLSVYCDTCKMIAKSNDTAFVVSDNINELHAEAIKRHQEIQLNTQMICVNPLFIISFENVLISNDLLNPKEKSNLIM